MRALEHGNLSKVTVCKIKTPFLPGDLSAWEAGSNTVEKGVSRVVVRTAKLVAE